MFNPGTTVRARRMIPVFACSRPVLKEAPEGPLRITYPTKIHAYKGSTRVGYTQQRPGKGKKTKGNKGKDQETQKQSKKRDGTGRKHKTRGYDKGTQTGEIAKERKAGKTQKATDTQSKGHIEQRGLQRERRKHGTKQKSTRPTHVRVTRRVVGLLPRPSTDQA